MPDMQLAAAQAVLRCWSLLLKGAYGSVAVLSQTELTTAFSN
jgi:hypothetical protein